MLKFLKASTKNYHYYYFKGEDGKFYYWKTRKAYNDCYDCGKLVGINALDYEIKKNGKRIYYDRKHFEEVKVSKWERCA